MTRPGFGWRALRARANAMSREAQETIRAAREARRAAGTATVTVPRPERSGRAARAPRPRKVAALAACGRHPTVATCAAGWNGYQPCRECVALMKDDPANGDRATCGLPGFPACEEE